MTSVPLRYERAGLRDIANPRVSVTAGAFVLVRGSTDMPRAAAPEPVL